MARSSQFKGLWIDRDNSRLDAYYNNTRVGTFDACGFTAPTGVTVTTGGLTVTAGGATITAGGLTVTAGQVNFGAIPAAACCLTCGDLYTSCACCVKTLHIV